VTGDGGGHPGDAADALADDTAAFRRYLRAKRTVDDRALDRRLLRIFRERLADRAAASEGPLRVLEAGAGIGTMVARLIDREVLPPGETRYVAVDVDGGALAGIESFLREWAADREGPAGVEEAGDGETDALVVETEARMIRVEPVADDAVAVAGERPGAFDALIGMALLDVFDLAELEALLGALAPGGTYYFPITFDGGTRFRPTHPADRAIERRYHAHMNAKPGGSSRAGGDALARLREIDGASLLGVAGSDWVVRPVEGEEYPGDAGGYPGDEAFFLRHILDTVEEAVGEVIGADGTATEPSPLSPADLDAWLETRREQVDSGTLVYLTHQLDLLGRVDGDA
jgi:hypothetical protein